jgi:hypothetical protein
MHHGLLARSVVDTEYRRAVILELDFIMLRIDFDGVGGHGRPPFRGDNEKHNPQT